MVGIGEGLAAGAWTVGLSATSGSGLGLSPRGAERAADRRTPERRIASSAQVLRAAGARYVVETVAELGPVLEDIGARCRHLEGPPRRYNGARRRGRVSPRGNG